jgi:3-hydroxyisobutyrate dehydrogenase-like beta-hydroxyacid dehydrogenase
MDREASIAFLGLGAMGYGMAINLIQQGFKVAGYDVFEIAIQRLATAGGKGATSPRSAVEQANVLICMVATEQQASHLTVLCQAEPIARRREHFRFSTQAQDTFQRLASMYLRR